MPDSTKEQREYTDDFKQSVVDEALKGEKFLRQIAEEFGVIRHTVTAWLLKHYEQHPDDPRRHKPERQSARFSKGANEGADDGAGETVGVDVAAKRKLKTKGGMKKHAWPAELKEKVLEALRNRGEGETLEVIAEKFGVPKGTISNWAMNVANEGKRSERGQAIAAGRERARREREQQGFSLQNPPASAPVTRTMVSTRAQHVPQLPPPSNGYGQATAVGVAVSFDEASQTTLKAALEERATLRGMVDILQRENEDLKRRLEAAYRRG